MAHTGGVDRTGGSSPQELRPDVPTYRKSWLAVGAVALVAIAAVGGLVAHFMGAPHMPHFMQSHQFQLATEIGSPLGAAFSIFSSVLITRAKNRELERQEQALQSAQQVAQQTAYKERVATCHPQPKAIQHHKTPEGDAFPTRQDARAGASPQTSRKGTDTSLSIYKSRPALIECAHSCSSDKAQSVSHTKTSGAYHEGYTLGKMTVDVYAPGKGHTSADIITRTIQHAYNQRLETLTTNRTSQSLSDWAAHKIGSDILTPLEKEQAMADAIQAATEGLKAPHVVIVRFGETLFVGKPAGVRVNLVSRNADNFELQEAGVYRLPIRDLIKEDCLLVTGDAEFTRVASSEGIAGLHRETGQLTSKELLNAALGKREPRSRDLGFAEEQKPMSCMVYRVTPTPL